jgi:CheY-like chemotaxis protein
MDGWETATAPDGREAMAVLQRELADGMCPDLIILDHQVTGGGWELRARLTGLGTHVPLVVMTDDPEPQRCAKEVDAVGYLVLPLHARDLDQLLDQVVITGTRRARGTQHARAA